MDKKIIDFISVHYIMTIATCSSNQPYCAIMFYAFLKNEGILAFMSHSETRHVQEALNQNKISGTIVLGTSDMSKQQGIQFSGIFFTPTKQVLSEAKKIYLHKFPVARFVKVPFWCIELTTVKMIDSRWGLGKKLIWKKQTQSI